jgi:rRNA-processing protein FCF1
MRIFTGNVDGNMWEKFRLPLMLVRDFAFRKGDFRTNSFKFYHRELLKRQSGFNVLWSAAKMAYAAAQRETLKVIMDSNALFVPLQFKIDVFNDLKRLLNRRFELILLSPVKRELEVLAEKGSPKISKNAYYALKLAEKCKYVEVDAPASALTDDVIVKIAKEWKAVVFTNDRQLRERLRDISVPVIYVRQKSRLEIDGMI